MIEIGPNLLSVMQNIIGLAAGCAFFFFLYNLFVIIGKS